MNEELIKRLIQLTPEQQELMDKVYKALDDLRDSGVSLMWDDENARLHAVNTNAFKFAEICDCMEADNYADSGFVDIPYWEAPVVSDYISRMWPDDHYFAMIENADRNLFNH